MDEPILGEINLIGFTFNPLDYEFCLGKEVSISLNGSLYALLGTHYGGDGRDTFKLPNLAQSVPVGLKFSGPDDNPIYCGTRGGSTWMSPTYISSLLPSHKHEIKDSSSFIVSENSSLSSSFSIGTGGISTRRPSGNSFVSQTNKFAKVENENTISLDMGSKALKTTVKVNGYTLSTDSKKTLLNVIDPYLGLNYVIAMAGSFPERK